MTDAPAVDDSVDRDRAGSTSDTAEPEQFSDANTFASRHAELARGYGGAEDPEDPSEVLAMPMVLHIPKADPPVRNDLLEAAARAVVALCLDPRVGVDASWHEPFVAWTSARIRKVARRARGAQWTAAQEVPGVTVEVGNASARAFVPGRVGDLDPRIKRLQIGGTDVPAEEESPPSAGPVLWIDASLSMTVGKAAAQVGHASMLLAGAMSLDDCRAWADSGFACSVRSADPEQWTHALDEVRAGRAVAVRDAGFTEVAPGSTTVIAVRM
ncbi:peptidyl-tRNA hydrolase [Rhodococcus fascians]|uniref:aminoacyl-tRNA hydrolase n=1 Tax=Rhodococcoides fascians TaxID=1828 RepID=UPI00050C02FF|nr:aminoacyl-tRNA hydrolase [Rhodococcus fascians]MBY4380304.1 peptidyl-tRNA hydrolase [Rhodococcus fascians]MBY4395229.1 peptidyl-tRNA hydrolase [Rhodococcus fascians]MBY4405030.1 peptidyl-tRNA hydrolase [Rhodococcus fascians]MBY4419453.1 peptidyl-tRNA hydrolase [Rhodococcus fascians]MBY4459299.1 peptidyl-tRNA hydrolase [Rhodococcus fascians]